VKLGVGTIAAVALSIAASGVAQAWISGLSSRRRRRAYVALVPVARLTTSGVVARGLCWRSDGSAMKRVDQQSGVLT
jgi:hypothetical protein